MMVGGPKRHVVTEVPGLLLIVVVTAANVDDGSTALRLLSGLPAAMFPRLAVLRVDNEYCYRGLDQWLAGQGQISLEVTGRSEGRWGFDPLPK